MSVGWGHLLNNVGKEEKGFTEIPKAQRPRFSSNSLSRKIRSCCNFLGQNDTVHMFPVEWKCIRIIIA